MSNTATMGKENAAALVPKHIIPDDIVSSISYMLGLPYEIGTTDDIDHLGNRRLRSVGELLQNQIRIGLSRLERVVRERMSIQDSADIKPGDLINIRPVSAAIKEFFGSSQLSQETGIKTIPKKRKCKKAKWLPEEALQIAVKRREAKSKGEKEDIPI